MNPAAAEARSISDPELAQVAKEAGEPELAQVAKKSGKSEPAQVAKKSVPPDQPQLRGGVVREIDTELGLVTVSIGRKHGVLQKGDTLELYRVLPNPRSLGKITVIDVSDDHSICRPDAAKLAEIRLGDAVYVNIRVDGPRAATASKLAKPEVAIPANALTKRTFAEAVAGDSAVRWQAKTPDGKVVAGVTDGAVLLMDAATSKELARIDVGRGEKVSSLNFSPDGKLLIVQTGDGKVREVETSTGKILRGWADEPSTGKILELDATGNEVRKYDAAKAPTAGQTPASGSWPRDSSGYLQHPSQRPADNVETRVQKLEEKLDAILLELRNMRGGATWPPPANTDPFLNRKGYRSGESAPVRSASADGKLVAVVQDESVRVLDAATGKEIRRIKLADIIEPTGVIFVDGSHLRVFGNHGKSLDVDATTGLILEVEASTGTILRSLDPPKDPPHTGAGFGAGGKKTTGDVEKLRWTLESQEANLGASHPDTMRTRNDLAAAYRGAGDLQRAIELHERALDIRKSTLGAEHPETIHAMANLAETYEAAGRAKEAVELKQRVTELSVKTAKEPRMDTAAVTANWLAKSTGGQRPPQLPARAAAGAAADASQIDLVNLATQYIEARGAVRLAESRHDRLARAGATISQEEVGSAAINLETARQKLDVLTRLAEGRRSTALAELAAAKQKAEYSRKLFEKGFVTQSEATEAAAQVTITEAKVKLIESILSPSSPAGATDDGAKPGARSPDKSIVREFPLKHARATDAVVTLEQLLGPSGTVPGVTFTANARTNSVFVVGEEDAVFKIEQIITRLDRPDEPEVP